MMNMIQFMQIELYKLVGACDLRPLWSPPVSLNLVSSIPLIGTDSS
jgi:hypothetical protein